MFRVEPAPERRATQSATIDDSSSFQHQSMSRAYRDLLDAMRRQHLGQRRAPGSLEPTHGPRLINLVETIQQFVQQQQLRARGQSPRQQYQPSLPIREREKASRHELRDGQPAQQGPDPASIGRIERAQRNVSAIQAGADHLLDGMIPTVALVLVLPLRPEIADLILDLEGSRPP